MGCRKARSFLEKKGADLELRDLHKQPLTVAELDRLIGKRDYRQFLRPKHELYRKRNFGQKPPSRREALALMAKHPDLIRRPLVVVGGRVVVGYDEKSLRELL